MLPSAFSTSPAAAAAAVTATTAGFFQANVLTRPPSHVLGAADRAVVAPLAWRVSSIAARLSRAAARRKEGEGELARRASRAREGGICVYFGIG